MALRILVIDDEREILVLVASCLADEGYEITTSSTLAQARKTLGKEKFDLIIVDIGLSDGSGLDFVQKIRTEFFGGIIILSGRSNMVDRVVGIELGADDYIVKPFHLREFRARIRAVQRRLTLRMTHQQATKRTIFHFCGFELNIQTRSLKVIDGEEIHLTTREFDVLRVLVEHSEKVVMRETIVSAAFGDGHQFGGRPVDGLVSRLREKLFPDGSGQLRLKTIRGQGYQITC